MFLQIIFFGSPIILSLILVWLLYLLLKKIKPSMSKSIRTGILIGVVGSILSAFLVKPIYLFFNDILFGGRTCQDFACLIEGTTVLGIIILLGALVGVIIGYLIHRWNVKNRIFKFYSQIPQKRKLVRITILSLFILSLGIFLFEGHLGKIMHNPNVCDIAIRQEMRELCYFNVAKDTSNFNLCSKITKNSLRHNCQVIIAWNTNNVSLCDEIMEERSRRTCNAHFERK